MKSIKLLLKFSLFITIIVYSDVCCAQIDTTVIRIDTNELAEIVITTTLKPQIHYSRFSTISFLPMVGHHMECGESLGIYIPSSADSSITIHSIDIPLGKMSGADSFRPDSFEYFVVVVTSGKDSIINLSATREQRNTRKKMGLLVSIRQHKMSIFFDKKIKLPNKISGFYLFVKPECKGNSLVTETPFQFTNRLKSHLTYKMINNKIMEYNNLDKEAHLSEMGYGNWDYPNWKVKIEYLTDK